MALYFVRKKLDKEIIKKICQELVISNGKEYMKCFRIDGAYLAVPYYYGKMLIEHGEMPFTEALEQEKQDYLLNLRSSHERISLKTNYVLKKKQKCVLREAEEELQKNGTICLNAATGFGKSVGIVHLAVRLGYLTLVFSDFVNLFLINWQPHSEILVMLLSGLRPIRKRKELPHRECRLLLLRRDVSITSHQNYWRKLGPLPLMKRL